MAVGPTLKAAEKQLVAVYGFIPGSESLSLYSAYLAGWLAHREMGDEVTVREAVERYKAWLDMEGIAAAVDACVTPE